MSKAARLSLLGLCLASSVVCTLLGLWQTDRLLTRRANNAYAMARRDLPVVDLTRPVLGAQDTLDQRRLVARGTWDHAHTFVLRARADRDAPGVHIVTPLRLAGRAEAVLVNRGFVPAPDAMAPRVTWRTPDSGTVTGIAFAIPSVPDSGTPHVRPEGTTWRRLDLATVRGRLPYPVLDVYLHVTEAEARDSAAVPWPTPARLLPLDDGPHLNYLFQWFSLAAASLAFGVIFLRKRSPAPTP